jgi:hypothetical protein
MSRALFVLVVVLAFPAKSAAQTYLLVVSGLGGERAYVERFHSWGTNLITAAVEDLGIPEQHVVYLAEDPERDPRIRARSTRVNVTNAFADLAERIEPDARLVVVFIGHGSTTGGEPKLNLPGPDLSVTDVAEQLRQFPSQEIAVVNLTTASGGWVAPLSGERRVVITATRSAAERYDTTFGEYFIAALTSDDADTDKNDDVSLLEAFEYARQEVARAYDGENRLLTEHALLDDNGDGTGAHEPQLPSGDGARAQGWFLATSATTVPMTDDPALASLYEERRRIESAVATLRAQKAATDSLTYEEQLESLLLSLARTNRTIREREGREQP